MTELPHNPIVSRLAFHRSSIIHVAPMSEPNQESKTRIALVSCVKSKRDFKSAARDLYISPLFRGLRRYAEANADRWYILSAEYGLVSPEERIEPYERTLKTMKMPERKAWAERVNDKLKEVLPCDAEVIRDTEIIFLAGDRYRRDLVPFLEERGFPISIPLAGRPIGEQLQALKQPAPANLASSDLERFYELLDKLETAPGQARSLAKSSGRQNWPERGVYFVRDPAEFRQSPSKSHRVVRVGTHAVSAGARTTLWGRLHTHRGARDGAGNHRRSIFRLHVGAALLRRDGAEIGELPKWSVGSSAPRAIRLDEAEHERRVSDCLGKLSVLWVEVPDEPGPRSARAFIERNAIALLSNALQPHDRPSDSWLGLHSPRDEIQKSGLWNLNHTRDDCSPKFLEAFELCVEQTISETGWSTAAQERLSTLIR